ncbi:MAG: TlpA family protein disulfide reductase [Cytophagaceae bacterium]|nr:TlpA family protein disulfide reductase [Cytophagaceae bacterium]
MSVVAVAEIPALNKLQENYADKVNFIAITFDDDKKVLRFLKNKEFNFKHITNANQFIEYIGTKPYPENIFIDKDGFIRNIEGGLVKTRFRFRAKYFGSIIEKLLLPTTKAQTKFGKLFDNQKYKNSSILINSNLKRNPQPPSNVSLTKRYWMIEIQKMV